MIGSLNAKAKTVACATIMGVVFIGVLLISIYCGGTSDELEKTFKGGPRFQQSRREKMHLVLFGKAQVDVLDANDTLTTDMDNKTNANAMTKGSNLACNMVIEIF